MKAIAFAVGLSVLAGPALAAGVKWVSAPVFAGQTLLPSGVEALTFYPALIAITPDSAGLYEVWIQETPHAQESFADHEAIQLRAACNATGDNSCVNGQPGWVETTHANPIFP